MHWMPWFAISTEDIGFTINFNVFCGKQILTAARAFKSCFRHCIPHLCLDTNIITRIDTHCQKQIIKGPKPPYHE